MEINVYEVINSKIAISPQKGELLYHEIIKYISSAENIKVNFTGIEDLTTAFLNKAIGQLYNVYSNEQLKGKLLFSGLDETDKYLVVMAIDRAKVKNDVELNNEISEVIGDDSNT